MTVKRCACGATYVLCGVGKRWTSLALCGLQKDEDGREVAELRHCTCGSTISVPVRRFPDGEIFYELST